MRRKEKKPKKSKVKEKKTKSKPEKIKIAPKEPEPEPLSRTDINTKIYRDLFKFLEERVSIECFVDLHDQCYGKINCQCECHKK